jgi:hypothetical protein
MSETYTYSVSADFPEQSVNLANLEREIRLSSIVTALDSTVLDGDTLSIIFKSQLSVADKTTLDGNASAPAGGLIAQHNSTATQQPRIDIVRIRDDEGETGGHFYRRSVTILADAESVTEFDDSVLVNTEALSVHFNSTREHEGDTIQVLVSPDSVIGTITSDVNIGDTVISVSQTVVDNAFRGPMTLVLDDGSQTNDLGHILNVDRDNLLVTVQNAATAAFAAATPTTIRVTIIFVDTTVLGPSGCDVIGESKTGGSGVPANQIVRLRYQNRSPARRVGQVTQDVSIGQTLIAVDAETIDALVYGDKIELNDGTTASALGTVERIDYDSSEILVSDASSAAFLSSTPTFVRKTAKKFIAHIEMMQ